MKVNKISKDPQISNIRLHTYKNLFRSLFTQGLMRIPIFNIYNNVSNFSPYKLWKHLTMRHSSGSFHDGLVLRFIYAIFLGVIRPNGLLFYSFFLEKVKELILNEFSSIIRPEDFDSLPCLILHQGLAVLKHVKCLVVMLQE